MTLLPQQRPAPDALPRSDRLPVSLNTHMSAEQNEKTDQRV